MTQAAVPSALILNWIALYMAIIFAGALCATVWAIVRAITGRW